MPFQACEDLWEVLHMSAGSHAFMLSNLIILFSLLWLCYSAFKSRLISFVKVV